MELAGPGGRGTVAPRQLAEVAAAMFVIGVAASLLHQMFLALTTRGGHVFFILLMVVANIVPPIGAASLRTAEINISEATVQALAATSPVALFGMNITNVVSPGPSAGPAIALYACLGIGAYLLLRRMLRREAAVVERKLQSMALAA